MDEHLLLRRAQAQPNAAAQAAFLDRACANRPESRARLEKLLEDPASQAPTLEKLAFDPAATVEAKPLERDGSDANVLRRLGPYHLLRKLGEGGMGAVWEAQQTAPIERRVAVKLIKPGMDSGAVLRRFEAERQVLARMEHSHIAKVFDAGTTSEGAPFFVMELIEGVPFTQYCDGARRTLRERLELFVPVCQAIQHAHQKGIIHRDIKPSNVLIALQDGKPVPKVIDFGVAKVLARALTDVSSSTEIGQVIGTLEYMSPEQADLNTLDIDTRADVYALGVLLYELLTGTTPLAGKGQRQAYAQVLRRIREEEPPRPSMRLRDSTESLADLATSRRTEPARLTKEVRGELDWIVLKCLEKDRTRRYETASALARDIERHLRDEPVEACPPSRRYRWGKVLRKHRTAVLTATAFAALLLASAAVSSWLAVRATVAERLAQDNERQARTERDDKEQARREAVASEGAARRAAEAERLAKQKAVRAAEAERLAKQKAMLAAEAERDANQKAQRRLKQVEQANVLLSSIFQDLKPRDDRKGGANLREQLSQRLVQAAARLEGEALGDPSMTVVLQDTLADTLIALGHAPEAVELRKKARATWEAAFGPDHPGTLIATNNLALAYQAAGQMDKAMPLLEQTLAKRKATLGADNPLTLTTMHNLAEAYGAAGQFDKAVPLLEQTLAGEKATLGADRPETLIHMNNLALAYWRTGQRDKSLALFEQTLEKMLSTLGPDHPATRNCMANLLSAYQTIGRMDKVDAWRQKGEQAKAARKKPKS